MYVGIICETFHIAVVNVQGGDDGSKSGGDVVVEGPVVLRNDTAQCRVPHDGTQVAGKPEEVSVYAVKSYAYVMCSASHGGRAQTMGCMVSAWRRGETCCHDGLHSTDPAAQLSQSGAVVCL